MTGAGSHERKTDNGRDQPDSERIDNGHDQPDGERADNDRRQLEGERAEFHREVAAKGLRRRRAREEGDRTLRTGWGAFGVVGWSIVVPTLIGLTVGMWLDARLGGGIRYTLSLLMLGLVIGMINVWNWMNAE